MCHPLIRANQITRLNALFACRVISSDKNPLGDVTDLKQESVKIHLNGDDHYHVDNNLTPGARLKLLKNELNNQMRKLKEEEWQKKLEEMKNEKYFAGEVFAYVASICNIITISLEIHKKLS